MKRKTSFLLLAAFASVLPASAQHYRDSKYYNPRTGHLDYGHRNDRGGYGHRDGDYYFGFRIGPSFSGVNSSDEHLNGGSWQTGLNVGFVAGIPLSDYIPLYLEPGLHYIEKGGQKSLSSGKKMTYSLNYLEVPVVLKYRCPVDDHFSVQPMVGGYVSAGLGGKLKNFEEKVAEQAFDEHNFKRVDAGLRVGCGVQYDMFYADLTYDIGLANISHDYFDTAHNTGLQINVGLNF